MARKPFSFLSLLVLLCFHAAALVSGIQLTDEILFFVPDCARGCFESFLDVNYEDNPCGGGLTSLQCLCANRGASGFTIGEGLVQCIAAERAIKFCSEQDATDAVFNRAFGMCNGKPGAIRATASIFTATLILPPSGPGVISFPPLTTTRTDFDDRPATSTSASTALRTFTNPASSEPTLDIDTSSSPRATPSSSFSTSRRTTATSGSPSSTGDPVPDIPAGDDSAADGAGAEQGDSTDGNGSSKLSPAQVAGISVGIASAAGLAAIAIFIARYYRRQRRLPDLRSLFSRRDTWPYTEKGSGSSRGGGDPDGSGSMAGVARQIEQPLDRRSGPGTGPASGRPPAYHGTTAGFFSPAIGVAVASPTDQQNSQQRFELPAPRPVSPLLPAKPVYIPPAGTKRKSKSPPSSAAFSDATMVPPPGRTREASPRDQHSSSPSPLTLADTITTRQQPSPVPPGSQQSPRRFPPAGPTAAAAAAAATTANSSQAQQPSFKPTADRNKPQPPLPPPPPPSSSFAKKLNAPPPAVLERDSAVTEFEEDGRISARSTGLSTSSKKNTATGGQVWYPPSAYPSGLTYYFADQSGNWVLRNSQQPPPSQQQQQQQPQKSQRHNPDNGNQDNIHPALRIGQTLAPAAEIARSSDLQPPAVQANLYPRSSSIYSPNMPRPLFSGGPRRSSFNANNNNISSNTHRRSSDDSGVTQFSAASSSGGDIMDPQPPVNLSPVAESPPQPVASANQQGARFAGSDGYRNNNRNSVGNNNNMPFNSIPYSMGERRNQNNLRLAARPPRSARTYHPPGQPSPTLGLMNPPPLGPIQQTTTSSSAYSRYQNPYSRAYYDQPSTIANNSNSNRNRNSSNNYNTSSTLRAVSPSPPPADRDLLPSNSNYNNNNNNNNNIISPISPLKPSFAFPPSATATTTTSTTNKGPWRPPLLNTNSHPSTSFSSGNSASTSSSSSAAVSQQQQQQRQPVELPVTTASSSIISPTSSANTTTSSLLAKRLGPVRAADMSFPAVRPPSTQRRWEQRGNAAGNGLLSPETPGRPHQQPVTPTWVPKLTPTRRGDDLFLNVQ